MPICELCGRDVPRTTVHHLIPRSRHRNKRTRREFSREEARTRLAQLCRSCHDTVHATLTEKELAREYNTLDDLRRQPEIARFLEWVADKPGDMRLTTRSSKDKRHRRGEARRRRQARKQRGKP
jgi:hypothetical protein